MDAAIFLSFVITAVALFVDARMQKRHVQLMRELLKHRGVSE